MNFEGIIAIINRRSGIYNQVINSWTRREGEGGAEALLGLIAAQGKAVTSDSAREQEFEAFSLLLFCFTSRAPPAPALLLRSAAGSAPHRAIALKAAPSTNNNKELKRKTTTQHHLPTHSRAPHACTVPTHARRTRRQSTHPPKMGPGRRACPKKK